MNFISLIIKFIKFKLQANNTVQKVRTSQLICFVYIFCNAVVRVASEHLCAQIELLAANCNMQLQPRILNFQPNNFIVIKGCNTIRYDC